MAEKSPVELRGFVSELKGIAGLLDLATVEHIERNVAAADLLGVPLMFNTREMTARDIYFAYAEGELFAEDERARRLFKA